MDEKKYIKYTIEDDLKLVKSFKEMVMEAVKHALKEGIKANSIIINKDFVRVKKSWINNGFYYSELPDMICGLECYLTDNDLTENYSGTYRIVDDQNLGKIIILSANDAWYKITANNQITSATGTVIFCSSIIPLTMPTIVL